jgi:hypothetical protein
VKAIQPFSKYSSNLFAAALTSTESSLFQIKDTVWDVSSKKFGEIFYTTLS